MSGTQSFEERADWLRETVAKSQAGGARVHPDLEEMAAYAEGGLPEGRRAEIQEHLVACASCARFALDLAEVAAEPFAATPSIPSVSAARWEKLHPRLVEEGLALPRAAGALAAWVPAAAGRRHLGSLGLAAALLASVLANGWQWKEAKEPRIAAEVVQLSITRGEPEATPIALAERSRHQDLVLQIDANAVDPFPGLKAEILTWPEKKLVWSGTLEREGAQLTLAIPTSFLDSREYQIRLWGKSAGADGWKKAGEHLIRISFPS